MPQTPESKKIDPGMHSSWLRIGIDYMLAHIKDGKVSGPANTIRRLVNIRWQDFNIGVISKLNPTEEQSIAYFEELKKMVALIEDVLQIKSASLIESMVRVLKEEEGLPLNYENFRTSMIPVIEKEKFKKIMSSCFFCHRDKVLDKLDSLLKTYNSQVSKTNEPSL